MNAEAEIEGPYRYTLFRNWEMKPYITWVMLNPSTADALKDDATIRKCIAFSKLWGYGGIAVVNLFAFRSTDPKKLSRVKDPVGPKNDEYIRTTCWSYQTAVVAWGRNGDRFPKRVESVLLTVKESGTNIMHLGKTTTGQPKHPLYLSLKTPLQVWA